MTSWLRVRLLLALLLALLGGAACSTQSLLSWEASDRARPHYQVQHGDTLYSIAWGYGVDFRRLAVVNDLHPPYPISPGQILRLPRGVNAADAPVRTVASAPRPAPAKLSSGTVASRPAVKPSAKPTKKPVNYDVAGVAVPNLGRWAWPHKGRVLKNWGARKHQKSGLDIAASPGAAVTASAAGVVVYSGGGLARYGQLIIVKHSEELLSAYAYNQSLLVNKGQRVRAGEKLALSGRSPDGVVAVHFEIRRRGKPVDALQYLKKRSG